MDELEKAKYQIFINNPPPEYSHQNPHPLFGKDPNILNAMGHTEYPKWVTIDGKEVIAKDKKHEMELLGEGKKELETPFEEFNEKTKLGWDLPKVRGSEH